MVLVVGSPTKDLLESVGCLLRDCERYFPNAYRNMTQNIIVRLQVTIDSVLALLNSLDRCLFATHIQYMGLCSVRKYMRVCLAYVCVERSNGRMRRNGQVLGEKTYREEKIASIRGKKPHVYRVVILKQMADHIFTLLN